MSIVSSAFLAFIQREQPISNFSFPRWQSVLAITLLGVLTGLDPRMTAPQPGMLETAVMSPALAIGFAVVLIWVCFPVCVLVIPHIFDHMDIPRTMSSSRRIPFQITSFPGGLSFFLAR